MIYMIYIRSTCMCIFTCYVSTKLFLNPPIYLLRIYLFSK